MRQVRLSDIFQSIVDRVDDVIANQYAPAALAPAGVGILVVMLAGRHPGPIWTVVTFLGVAFAIVCTGLTTWRLIVHLQRLSVRGDEDFDKSGKHRLSAEYHASESVTAANRGAKRRRGRDLG